MTFIPLVGVVGAVVTGNLLPLAVASAGLLVARFAIARPDLTVLALIAGLPFNDQILGLVLKLGVPGQVVELLTAWKEFLVLVLLCTAARAFRERPKALDAFDWLALTLGAMTLLHFLLPAALSFVPVDAHARLVAFRGYIGLVAVFLAVRHVPFPDGFRDRFSRWLVGVGTAVAVTGLLHYFFVDWWRRFLVDTLGWVQFMRQIRGVEPWLGPLEVNLRPGGVFIFGTTLASFLAVPFIVALFRITSGRGGVLTGACVGVMTLAIVLTASRASAVASVVAAAAGLIGPRSDTLKRRAVLALCATLGLLLLAPALARTHLVERAEAAAAGTDVSTESHWAQLDLALDVMLEHPTGLGLGTGASAGAFNADIVTAESAFLEVGAEIGVLAMAVFAAIMVLLIVRGRREGSWYSRAMSTATLALALVGLVLHLFTTPGSSWWFWAAAGLAVPAGAPGSRRSQDAASRDTKAGPIASHEYRVTTA